MGNDQIAQAINQLITQTATNVPLPTLASLDLNLPTGEGLDAKWREFLDRAAKDPDIIKYYQSLLDQAKGDTNLARGFIEKDYQVGTRQVQDNLMGTLAKLTLTSQTENQDLANNLNQRGIAMTDIGGGKTAYAAGGQPATELSNLNQAQALRKEAEQRSAKQNIETAGLTREKNLTTTGQELSQTAQSLAKAKQQDILGRGQQYYNIYQDKIKSDAQQKINQQNNEKANSDTYNLPVVDDTTAKQYGFANLSDWRKQTGRD